jgi:hypothetical protein
MNKKELWNLVVKRYPDFADDEHVLKQTARGLRRLINQAWDEGKKRGLAERKAKEPSSENPFERLFR